MAAYRKWVKEGDAYLEAAKGIIQSAINGGKLSAKEKAELEKLLATMEGDDPTVTPDEIGKLEVSADAPQAVKDALTIQSWAGKDYAYVNITDDDMTITELLGYLTAGGKDLSFVDAIDRTNGPLTADRTASAAKKITAKIGGTIFIINVTAEADPDHAKQFFTVNYTEGQATVTLKNGGTAVKSGEPLAKDTVVVIKYITDGFKDHATKDKDGNAVTGTGTNSEEFTLTKDLYVTATALTAADIADAKLTAALAKVPATIGYETKLEADHTEAKTKAYIKELVEKAIADSSVTVAVAIKTSEVYTAPTVKGTAVTNKFTITLSAENMTAAQTVNKDVACKFTSTAADEEAAAITAAVKSAINAKYSVTEYDSWAECKAAIIEAIEGVEGVTEVTALTIDPDFESDTIWEGGRYCTITFTFKWTDSAGAEQTASNIEANISTIK